jgi:hypothetical protein
MSLWDPNMRGPSPSPTVPEWLPGAVRRLEVHGAISAPSDSAIERGASPRVAGRFRYRILQVRSRSFAPERPPVSPSI